MAELRPNRVKNKLAAGLAATVVAGPHNAEMIEHLGALGVDGVWIEGEHGPIDYADIPDLTRACDLWGITSVVRVNLNLPGVIYRTLDVGATGIVVAGSGRGIVLPTGSTTSSRTGSLSGAGDATGSAASSSVGAGTGTPASSTVRSAATSGPSGIEAVRSQMTHASRATSPTTTPAPTVRKTRAWRCRRA